jgi:hypothetical protein
MLVIGMTASACGGGGGLKVGNITGPLTVSSGATVQFTIAATGDTGITYQWVSDPISAGTLTDSTSATVSFEAVNVAVDVDVTITVTVNSDNGGPLVDTIAFTVLKIATDAGWARTWGGSDYDSGFGIVADNQGNAYITGYFSDEADLDPGAGTVSVTSEGGEDIFLSKYDPAGNFLWAITIGGVGDDDGEGVAIDPDGDIYLFGYFSDSVDFDPGTGTAPLVSEGEADVFLLKLDSDADFLWAKSWGGTGNDDSDGILLDGSDIYLIGTFRDTVDFNSDAPGTMVHTSNGDDDDFVMQLDDSGAVQWVTAYGGADYDALRGLNMDPSGNLWIVGFFYNAVTMGTFDLTSNGEDDAYLAEIDTSDGSFTEVFAWGGIGTETAYSVVFDSSENPIVSGIFSDVVDFDIGTGVEERTSVGNYDGYLLYVTSAGEFVDVLTWGGTENDYAEFVVRDSTGNVYVAFEFQETMDLDPGSGTEDVVSAGSYDVALVKLTPSRAMDWGITFGSTGDDFPVLGTVGPAGEIFVSGGFEETVDFDPGSGTDDHVSNGVSDAFIVRFLPTGEF